ncbi:MAG: MraY family glycosyltransferase [Armatimonadota bacterium]|nr:undecaprenyl/decaprenyl-phosphate alpha-N-acetylglucosaminyl 1-phosphate transferase [Armatimonadota bacterium]MCX7778051.1 undecaprenyl/decaprenyl-phosphate alpha-N-acetylglucosaminyl 1-phosphate transferase [Armatimonadota bacterium]MDW8026065.1 MraY family glycosyltransferase [Armatimonadota bacterium]
MNGATTEVMQAIAVVLAFLTSCAVTLLITPSIKRLATAARAVDDPARDERRIHTHPIPRLGGLALLLGVLFGTLIGWVSLATSATLSQKLSMEIGMPWVGILVGAICIAAIGALDDIFGLGAWVKLLGQIFVALLTTAFGARILFFKLPAVEGYIYLSTAQSVFLTVFWIIVMVNAVNLIDGLDGLAAGVSFIAALTLCILTFQQNILSVACGLASVAGACIGFLPYNFNPARIFMGDTGALLLGYLFATMSVVGTVKSALAIWLLPITAVVLGYPIMDTLFAILRRASKLQPIFKADKAHLHHRLLQHGLTHRQAVLVLYALSFALCVAAYALSQLIF